MFVFSGNKKIILKNYKIIVSRNMGLTYVKLPTPYHSNMVTWFCSFIHWHLTFLFLDVVLNITSYDYVLLSL